jgi:bacterioferritin (cytochrome b1)
MATLVGTQSNFTKVIKELIELDYDAVEAYEAAISRLKNTGYKEHMQKFKKDHERHVTELNEILLAHGEQQVTGPSAKQWLTKGKVVLSDMVGDDITILKAMLTNEEDTNKAYERANNHEKKWDSALKVLAKGLDDERHHKKWIETALKDVGS